MALGALVAGESVMAVSRRFSLNHKTVIEWRDAAGLGSTHVEPQKKAEIGERVVLLLDRILTTLQAQSAAFDDPAWLKKHPPSEAAILYGVLADKAIYLAASLEAQDEDGP